MGSLGLALRLARREMRGGLRSLRIVLACLALGVAAIAAVGTLRAAIQAGLQADGAKILGGDVELRTGAVPAPEGVRDWIGARGGVVSEVVSLRAMLVAPEGRGGGAPEGRGGGAPEGRGGVAPEGRGGVIPEGRGGVIPEGRGGDIPEGRGGNIPEGRGTPPEAAAPERMLVELKAVDAAYPLYGTLALDPPVPLEPGMVALDPLVAERLGLRRGDLVRIGEARLRVAALIAAEPDKVATPALFGPRALIALGSLEATALIQPGSLVNHELRIRLPATADPRRFAAALRADFAAEGWRVRTADAAEPGLNRFLDRAAAFLTLAGLTALLVGGIGVATGVHAWLEARARSIATLRCLGASSGTIFLTYLVQVLALAALGTGIGLVAGWGLTALAATALAGSLPVPPRLGLHPLPLGLAALYGLLTALAFALWPLGRAARIPGAALFRDTVSHAAARPAAGVIAANLAVGAALVGLVIGTAEEPRFAAAFCAAALAALLAFRLGAAGLMRGARALRHVRRPALRLGLANLHRPGAPTAIMVVSLGIGLTTLAAIAQIEGNLRRQLQGEMSARAPNFFFIDIQSDQAARFDSLAGGLPGVEEVRRVPSLRARVVAVNGVPAEQVQVTPQTRWALNGDRGLTYAPRPPEGTLLVAGHWWPEDYRGPPLLSFDAAIAAGWGVGVGDTITVNILGRDIPLTIANLRRVDWRGLGLNFTLVASPGLLEAAPHTHIATLRGDPGQDAAVLRAVTDAFPNVSGIRVRDALEGVAALLGRIGTALTATGSVTLLAGALVLAGAVAAGQRQRIRDAVVLKTIGATAGQIRAAWMVEFALIGLLAGGLAALAGSAASWAVVRFVMRAEWTLLPGTLAASILGCAALTMLAGQIGTALALRARPGPLLRNE